MIFLRIKFFLLGSLCLSYGDVSNLLKPINFNDAGTKNSITGTHTSALIAPKSSTSGFPRYRSEANTDKEISLGISEIEQKLSNSLQNRYQSGGTISAKLTRSWVPLKVTSKFVLKIIDCMPDELAASSFIRFEIWDEGKLVTRAGEPVRVSHFVDVYVAKQKLLRGVNLSPNSFSIQSVDMLRKHAGAVPASSSLTSYELSSSVNVGSPLKWNNLNKINLVKRGEVVDVFAAGDGIYITMKGVCLDDGVQGGTVRIKNLSSDKEFHAKVLNKNSVKVNL